MLPIRNNVYMLVGDGANIVVQTGDEGAFVVDSGAGQLTDKVLAAIRRLSAKPIQFIANTSFHADHTGGNEKLKNAGSDPSVAGTFLSLQFPGAGATASIMAHENVAARMDGSLGNPPTPAGSWPMDTYMAGRRRKFHNGDSIEMFYVPNASTDGDSIVHFRRADVIVAGDVFTTTQFPFLDLANGGSIQGEIDALDTILSRTVFEHSGEGGTLVVPGRRLSLRRARSDRVSGYARDYPRPGEGADRERSVAGSGKGGKSYRGLRDALRREFGALDDGDVRRSGV